MSIFCRLRTAFRRRKQFFRDSCGQRSFVLKLRSTVLFDSVFRFFRAIIFRMLRFVAPLSGFQSQNSRVSFVDLPPPRSESEIGNRVFFFYNLLQFERYYSFLRHVTLPVGAKWWFRRFLDFSSNLKRLKFFLRNFTFRYNVPRTISNPTKTLPSPVEFVRLEFQKTRIFLRNNRWMFRVFSFREKTK